MDQLLAETTDVATWLTADLAVMGVSVASFIVVGLWWMARHATVDRFVVDDESGGDWVGPVGRRRRQSGHQ